MLNWPEKGERLQCAQCTLEHIVSRVIWAEMSGNGEIEILILHFFSLLAHLLFLSQFLGGEHYSLLFIGGGRSNDFNAFLDLSFND